MIPIRRALTLCITAMLLAACATPQLPLASTESSATSASPSIDIGAGVAAARGDLDLLLDRLEAIHPDPWHGVSRAAFVSALEQLKADLPNLDADQSMVAVMRLVGMISAAGRDGHMFALPTDDDASEFIPLRVYEFDDGVFVTDATADHADLVGTRIVAVGEHPMPDVLAALEPLVPRDGPATVPAFRPLFLLRPAVLRGLGLIGPGPVTITVDAPGGERKVPLAPISRSDYLAFAGPGGPLGLPSRPDVRWLKEPTTVFSVEYLSESRTLYARYRQVRAIPGALVDELEEMAVAPDVDRVVLDLRQNGGGDNHTYVRLLNAVRSDAIDRPGRLFLLTDRLTFSAAANFSTEVEGSTGATFVGEPMGGGLNFWDDVSQLQLPDLPIPMQVGISVRYWQKSTPDDPRLTITPQIPVPVLSADYFAGADPVLDAVLAQ